MAVLTGIAGVTVLCAIVIRSGEQPAGLEQKNYAARFGIKSLNVFMPESYAQLANALDENRAIPQNYGTYFKVAAKFMPDDFASHYMLALYYQSRGEWAEAQEAYKKSLDLNPVFFWSYYNLGLMLWENDRRDMALRIWSQALKIPPEVTLQTLVSTKVLGDCAADLALRGHDINQSVVKGYSQLQQWVKDRQVPQNPPLVML